MFGKNEWNNYCDLENIEKLAHVDKFSAENMIPNSLKKSLESLHYNLETHVKHMWKFLKNAFPM